MDVSLEVARRRNILIYGDNGSGKTTLLNLLLGFIEPVSGKIEGGTRKAVGIFEDIDGQLFYSTVFEELSTIAGINDEEKRYILSSLKLESLLKRSTFELSYSEKARLVFSVAYLSGKEFMIIDCPPVDEEIAAEVARGIEQINTIDQEIAAMAGKARKIFADEHQVIQKRRQATQAYTGGK